MQRCMLTCCLSSRFSYSYSTWLKHRHGQAHLPEIINIDRVHAAAILAHYRLFDQLPILSLHLVLMVVHHRQHRQHLHTPKGYSFSAIGNRGAPITYSLSSDSNTMTVRNNVNSHCGGSATRESIAMNINSCISLLMFAFIVMHFVF
jgi:hypothetical protein